MKEKRRTFLKLAGAAGASGLAGARLAPTATAATTYSIDSDLTNTVDVTGTELDDAMQQVEPGTPLAGLGDTFVDVQAELGVNAVYMAAHAAHESAWGRSRIAQEKNNLYGWRAYDSCPGSCAATFASFDACVRSVMPEIDSLYLEPGGTYYTDDGPTPRGMNRNYATDPNWAEAIADWMNAIDAELSAARGPAFEVGQSVVTTGDVNVRTSPEVADNVVHTNPDGTVGSVTDGPTENDGYLWWEVSWDNGESGWSVQRHMAAHTRDGDRFAVDDRIETTADLSVREGPGTSYARKDVVASGSAGYVRDGPTEADGYTWYKTGYNAGVEGWSAGEFMQRAPVESAGTFETDQRVATTVELNVREGPGTGYDVVATTDAGDAGYVRDGPTTNDGYTWWKVGFNDGFEGYCVETYLDAAPVEFGLDQRVATTTTTTVRASSDADAAAVDDLEAGAPGYVRSGPESGDGQTWWEVAYNAGVAGWTPEADLDPDPLEGDPAFAIGQDVATTADLNVRADPSTDADVVDTVAEGTGGVVENGFVTADGYTWWEVAYDTGTTGWSVEAYLADGSQAEFVYPLGGPITSDWYDVRDYGYHRSLDIAADTGTPIVAAREGTVANVVYLDAGGKSVFVDHDGGYQTRYMHLSEYAVSEGDTVTRGDTVGYVGETGRASGPHLHFEVERDGENQFIPGERGDTLARGDPIPQEYAGIE